ncbi:hypothetical protein PPTG_20044 [Phytophthora nicotianae INRA-310]|uniref:Chromo domain-containing protein n=1 Tax=Phytophthora nicotianae (strain INRA-310) TaxID=761204 RepID=W2PAY2_PHYN3|nr:hypothetical protein PPTG_20044 [Phytophthora nicotianae INRA-310]ETM97800.1 hypothetical protein PPTG_20044 [Phytophthora nicotianae INRA-310]
MHKPKIMARAQQTERNQRRNQHTQQPNFDVGDYVLRHLVTGEETDVHTSRLKFYADSSLHITEEIRVHVAAQGQLLAVNELLDYRWNTTKKDYDILVSWKGMEPIEDSWESAKSLAKDILVLLKQFTAGREDSGLDRHLGALMT